MGFLQTGKRNRQAIARAGAEGQQRVDAAANWLEQNPLIQSQMRGGQMAQNAQMNLLGLGADPSAQQQAFENFRNSTGYQFRLGEGMNAVSGNAAARGLLNSGATLRALNQFGQNSASAEFGNFFNQLGGMNDRGTRAVGAVGDARMNAATTNANIAMQGAQGMNANRGGGGNALFGNLIGAGISAVAGGFNPMSLFGGGGNAIGSDGLRGRF